MYLEFVVVGPPISSQQRNPRGQANLAAWKAKIIEEANAGWPAEDRLQQKLKVIIINFHVDDKPSVDVDNMSKPILDAMQRIVYDDDR